MKSSNKILILGSIGLDTIETQYGKKESLLGGSATYATIAAGINGAAIPLGIVGNDFPSEGYEVFSKYSKLFVSKIDSHSSNITARCWYRLMNKSKTCNLQSGVLSKSLTTNQMSIDLR